MTHIDDTSGEDEAGRVLIVDDETNARDALEQVLRDEGYVTTSAVDGIDALEKITAFSPDVVLTDLAMPRLDGFALIERARSLAPHAVFIVMTGLAPSETAAQSIRRGADTFLRKPLDVAVVSAHVARAVERARLSQEAAELRARLERRGGDSRFTVGTTLAELERLAIQQTLDAVGGSTARAAQLLGISRRKIQYRLREWSGGATIDSATR